MTRVRGWCPTVHEPMAAGDGLLARVKPPGGRLSAEAAREIATAADALGNGVIELTRRGGLQVRGFTTDSARAFAQAMVRAGLARADAGAERRRNVLVSPLAGDDPGVAPQTEAVAAEVEAMLAEDDGFEPLPPKFCVAVDGGGVLPLAFAADIVLRIERLGLSWSAKADHPRLTHAFRSRGWSACADHGRRAVEPLGFHPYPCHARGAFGYSVPFGQMDAATLRSIAGLAEQYADGFLRLSPWRVILFGSVASRHAPALRAAAESLGFIADPADPRWRIDACVGSPACPSAHAPARADAARLAMAGFSGSLHVSGCAKGCARSKPATVTLVGEPGGYALVRDGRADDAPERRGLTAGALASLL